MDLEGNVFEMNEIAMQVLEYDLEKQPINVVNLIYPEDYEYAMNSYAALLQNGRFSNYTARIVAKGNKVKWVSINASIIYKNNTPVAAQGVLRDITEEKIKEKQLLESQTRLFSLIKNLGSAVLLEDENGKIVITNQRFCNKFGIQKSPEELVGTICFEQLGDVQSLFLNPDEEVAKIQEILTNKKPILADEVLLRNGNILERNYIPIFTENTYKGNLWTYKNITLSRQYSKSLEQQKEKYSRIIANMNLGLLEVDTEDRVLMTNHSFTQMSGYTLEDIKGKKASDIFLKEQDKKIIEENNKERLKGKSNSFEISVKTKSGEERVWLVSGAPNFNLNGDVIGSIGIHLDITEIKKKNELIERQQKELAAIVDNAPYGILLTDKNKIIKTNLAAQNMLGYSEEELTQLTVDNISVLTKNAEVNSLRKQMNIGLIDNFEVQKEYYKKNGSVLQAKTNVSAVRNKAGEIKHSIAIIEDITQKQQEKLVIDTINNVAKSILGKVDIYDIAWEIANNIANYLRSNDCVIYLVNQEEQTLEQIAAYTNKTTKHKQIKNKIILPLGKGIVGEVAKNGKAELINDTSKDKRYVVDEEIRYSEITVPIKVDGKVIGVIDAEYKSKNYFTQKHIETIDSIASLVALQLKSAVNIRALNEAQEKNTALLKKLEISNAELNEYAHVVSHDLKSPLRSISALTSWIKMDNFNKFDKDTLSYFKDIDSTLETMESLISNILEYSSIESKQEGIKENVDLNTVLKELTKAMFIPDNFSVNVKKELPILRGDKVKYQQLFQNFISNAIKYNDKEQGFVAIDYKEHPSFYEFSISDNGIGIEKKHYKKIFKIFQALKKTKGSTGVGLSIVKKIVDLYGGEIWLESEINKGTTFYFTIKK